MSSSRRLLTTLALTAILAVPGAAAVAQDQPELVVREADLAADGTTRVLVQVGGPLTDVVLDASAFTVLEDGVPVEDVTVQPLLEAAEREPVVVGLVVDVSGSTQGEPLERTRAAATGFVQRLTAQDVLVALTTFGDAAQVVVPPTDDTSRLLSAIEGLEAAGETALFDGVALAADAVAAEPGQRHLVVFSDGADTVSTTSADEAVRRATGAEAAVTGIFLQTSETDPVALAALAAGTGGAVRTVDETADLAGAFDAVVRDIASQYVLRYAGVPADGDEIALSVSVTASGGTITDELRVLDTREAAAAPRTVTVEPPPARVIEPSSPLARSGALPIVAGTAFLALVLLLSILVVPHVGTSGGRALRRGLEVHRRADGARRARGGGGATASGIGQAATSLVERIPKPAGYDERLQARLDRSGWPLRASEFLAIRVALVAAGLLVGAGLFQSVVAVAILVAAGVVVPVLLLNRAVQRRRAAFMEQLPDTLQLLSGSLKAGYGILQGLDTLVKESPAPTSTEFQRVLTEARLGLPVDESLQSMADRIDAEDFTWVVVAVNIQSQVGGNLADLLDTVADTLRERAMVRRQVSVLSAEGRLSAIILVVLPFLLAGYMAVVNPSYLLVLFETLAGRIMVGGGLALMAAGGLWMRKLVRIEI